MQVWLDASTLHIRFNNPARHNALSVDMWEAIPVLLAQAEVDERVRLVVFRAQVKRRLYGRGHYAVRGHARAREAVSRYEQMAENALMVSIVSASRRWRAFAAIASVAASMSPSAVICASRRAIRCFPFLPRVWAWVTATRR